LAASVFIVFVFRQIHSHGSAARLWLQRWFRPAAFFGTHTAVGWQIIRGAGMLTARSMDAGVPCKPAPDNQPLKPTYSPFDWSNCQQDRNVVEYSNRFGLARTRLNFSVIVATVQATCEFQARSRVQVQMSRTRRARSTEVDGPAGFYFGFVPWQFPAQSRSRVGKSFRAPACRPPAVWTLVWQSTLAPDNQPLKPTYSSFEWSNCKQNGRVVRWFEPLRIGPYAA